MKRIPAILLLLSMCHTAQAASLKVWPIKMTLSPERATESVRVTNGGDAPVNVQISAKSWDIDESGQFIEADTGDFVFFPRLLTLAPKEEKLVRVGYQGKFPALEKPYRLIIQELPPVLSPEKQTEKKAMGVTYALHLSVPLFVMPNSTPPPPQVAIDGWENTKSGFKFGVKAPGTHHIQVHKVEARLLGQGDAPIGNGEIETPILRILPHRRVFVEIPMKSKACSRAETLLVKVHAEGLKTPYEQRLPVAPGGKCAAR